VTPEQTRFHKEPEYKEALKSLGDKVDWKDFAEYVREIAAGRKNSGNLHDELDFALGAATAFFYFSHQDNLPSMWIFGPLGNNSPFGFDGKEDKT
jgi:hypothetical protein